MAIGNVTPDSFYASSRLWVSSSAKEQKDCILRWAKEAIADGADILDIGGCSTRPCGVYEKSTPASEEEEWLRVEPALRAIREALPEVPLSLDTFRPAIAEKALQQFGPMIINDISGGCEAMYDLVRKYRAPYVWTLCGQLDLPKRMPEMQDIDLILDPGFGFINSTEADYTCMRQLDRLKAYERPVLVGVSRKSMLWRPLGLTPDTCLCATQALQLYALEHGASILRTHDVKETKQTITLWEQLSGSRN